MIDWFLSRSKKLKTSFKRIRLDINKVKKDLKEIKVLLDRRTTPLTTRSATPKATQSKLKSSQKELLNILDKKQLTKAIQELIKQNYKTINIRDEIIDRFKIKTTCFYKYLRIAKETTSHITTRTTSRS